MKDGDHAAALVMAMVQANKHAIQWLGVCGDSADWQADWHAHVNAIELVSHTVKHADNNLVLVLETKTYGVAAAVSIKWECCDGRPPCCAAGSRTVSHSEAGHSSIGLCALVKTIQSGLEGSDIG